MYDRERISDRDRVRDRDHSDREYMVKESLAERTLLLAAALPRCRDRFASASDR